MGSSSNWTLRRLAAGSALVGVCACVLPAQAQSPADRETARSLMNQGDAAVARKDFAAAKKAYQSADELMHVPTTGLALARAQVELGELVEARDTALRVVRIAAQPKEPAVFAEARADAQKLADDIANRIPTITIVVEGGPTTGTKVTLDGSELPSGQIGVARKLNPGKHVVVASAEGFAEARAEVNVAEGAREDLALKLEPGRSEGAGSAPFASSETTSGGTSSLVYIGFGMGAVGIGVGSVTGLMSLSKASAAEEDCQDNKCPPSAQDDIDSSKTLANISNVGFAVGLVGIGVGIYGLLSSKPASSERPPTARAPKFEPVVAGRFIGLRGRF
jgi:hypothetical protein